MSGTSLQPTVRGPKITVSCRCGEKRHLAYGERWTCESCGRTWDTHQIPAEQYAAIRATQLRYRRIPLAISLVALGCIVAGVLAGKALGGLIIVAIAGTTWSMFFRPIHSRKYRKALAQLPTWTLTPE
ncbi:MAG: hypothetical protein WAL22_23120 [Solirubrobacteraceae bacterium]